MWIDSHCHVHFEPLSVNDIKDALRNGIDEMLCVGTSLTQAHKLKEFKKQYPQQVKISIGEHPLNENLDSIDWEHYKLIAPEFDAIGEIGFDIQGDLKFQRDIFDQQAQIAIDNNLPVILHTRDSEEVAKDAIKNFPNLKGVLHCFTGSRQLAEFAIERGWYVSFSGIITFKNAVQLREVLKIIPKKLLLIETDSPYLAPHPFRGKVNCPKYVRYVGEYIAEFLDEDMHEFAAKIKENFHRFINK